ncbi:deoxynucleotidyltransferase terminal-interacting protein 2 [Venturia canescens]|uniref:deoxynucleotidyltransferase terminal-interacting protein 2 n=1 Tax=Venturia canescens TaxID=32260 RepID=UPI001C9C6FAB|nr:deoxynucleotidyltransferase terminal-interacting protein 2 [Venturia canescens]
MDFLIDTRGQADLVSRDQLLDSDDDVEFEDIGLEPSQLLAGKKKPKKLVKRTAVTLANVKKLSTKDLDLDEFEKEMGWNNKRRKQPKHAVDVEKITNQGVAKSVDELMKKSVLQPGFEQLERVPKYEQSLRTVRRIRQKEREKTKGAKWFNLPATEMTDEIKHDLEVIQMRSVLDPKHFYKKNDIKALPKYFQIGKVIDSPLDYYNGRLTKKERKRTIVDELMADAEFSKFNKRKYKEILDDKRKLQYKAHKHARKLKNKKRK